MRCDLREAAASECLESSLLKVGIGELLERAGVERVLEMLECQCEVEYLRVWEEMASQLCLE